MRITATSMTSWRIAPQTAGRRPTAATPMAAMESAIPATMLSMAIRRVRRAIAAASPRRSNRSTVSTTSAASEAAVAPRAPRATPTSARASAGASLTPSPTIMVGARRVSSFTTSSFSAGERSASTSSTPMTAPTVSATSVRSPVTITIRSIPLLLSERRVRAASGRRGSSNTRTPAGTPSMPTKTVRAPSRCALRRAERAHLGVPVTPDHDAFPTATWRPATVPRMPWPASSSTPSGSESSHFCSNADWTTALARTWGETWSREAAS